jgi:ferric-dicitrate binding protein FerR (iron transport regulator)
MSQHTDIHVDGHADDQHDADIVLITDYLAGELSSTDEARVEHRLQDDEAFFNKVFPLVQAWRMPHSVRRVSVKRRHRTTWLGALAAAAVLAFVVIEAPRRGIQFGAQQALPVIVSGGSVATGPVETREVMLEDSTRVVLRPRSTLAYSRALSAGSAAIARIRGEVVFDVARTRAPLTVETSAGLTSLGTGRYAIRCAEGAREMLVTVERGTAMLRSAGSTIGGWLALGAGQFGRVRDDARPSRDTGAGFPEVASSSH